MAQWLGQFMGKTQQAAVTDAEQLLVHAIAVLKGADVPQRPAKAKAVRALAKRVLSARAHSLKARIKAVTQVSNKTRPDPKQVERLQAALTALITGGVPAILIEFHAESILPP